MKINKNELSKALDMVKPGLSAQEMIEQSTSFCFLNGRVITYNDQISISYPLDIDLEGAINSTELYAFVKKVSNEEIDVSIDDREIRMKAGRAKAGFVLQSEIKLPINEVGDVEEWKDLPKGFLKALRFTMGSCSNDMTAPVLTCVHINGKVMEASDRFRITKYQLKKAAPLKQFLLPAAVCGTVIAFKPVQVSEGEGWVHFKNKEDAVLSCRVFQDKFPDVSRFLVEAGEEIKFPSEIKGILERATIFSKKDNAANESIELEFSKKKVVIRARSDSGWFEEKARVDYIGKEVTFVVTPYLLQDILDETNVATLNESSLLFTGEEWQYLSMLRGTAK